MKCSKCGCQNNQNDKYCFNCGNYLNIDKSAYYISLSLGIVCFIISFFLNIICVIPGIISIIYAFKSKKEINKIGVGIFFSIAGIIISIIILIVVILLTLNVIKNVSINNDFSLKELHCNEINKIEIIQ